MQKTATFFHFSSPQVSSSFTYFHTSFSYKSPLRDLTKRAPSPCTRVLQFRDNYDTQTCGSAVLLAEHLTPCSCVSTVGSSTAPSTRLLTPETFMGKFVKDSQNCSRSNVQLPGISKRFASAAQPPRSTESSEVEDVLRVADSEAPARAESAPLDLLAPLANLRYSSAIRLRRRVKIRSHATQY